MQELIVILKQDELKNVSHKKEFYVVLELRFEANRKTKAEVLQKTTHTKAKRTLPHFFSEIKTKV